MRKLWSTDDVEARDRLPFWIDAVCKTYVQLDCDHLRPNTPFTGHIEGARLATLDLSKVTASPQCVRRTPAKIAAATENYVLVSIQIGGAGAVLQDDRIALLEPDDFALYDSTRPYELKFEGDFQQYVLQMPGEVLRSRLKRMQTLTARKVRGDRGAGHLMIGMIAALTDTMETLEAESIAAVADSVENILIAGLSSLPGASDPVVPRQQAFHRSRIKAYALQRLRDPDLSIEAIAAHLRLSASSVHRAFAGEPQSLNAWIWDKRLDGAKRDLCDPALMKQSISEIAFAWGFNDAAHFSRVFRTRYCRSPRDLRGDLTRPLPHG